MFSDRASDYSDIIGMSINSWSHQSAKQTNQNSQKAANVQFHHKNLNLAGFMFAFWILKAGKLIGIAVCNKLHGCPADRNFWPYNEEYLDKITNPFNNQTNELKI